MTLKDIMEQVYRELGEPSDLEIYTYDTAGVATFDNSIVGSTRLIALINRAYKRLTLYKQPSGIHLKFRAFHKFVYFKPVDISKVIVSHTGSTIVVTNAGSVWAADALKGAYVTVNGAMHLIVGNDATDTVLDRTTVRCFDDIDAVANTFAGQAALFAYRRINVVAYTATPSEIEANQCVICQRDAKLVSTMRIMNISQYDLEVSSANRNAIFFDRPQGRQDPTLYRQLGNSLEFNYVPVSGTTFRVDYYAEPETLVADAVTTDCVQEPVIPEAWHDVIAMIAVAIRLREDKNIEEAVAKDREIDKLLMQLSQETEHEFNMSNARISTRVYFGG